MSRFALSEPEKSREDDSMFRDSSCEFVDRLCGTRIGLDDAQANAEAILRPKSELRTNGGDWIYEVT